MKRNKLAMQWMREDVTDYLTRTNNNPHQAWDLFVKEHLQSGKAFPNWIKGKKDFIKVSKELQKEIDRQKEEEQYKRQIETQKEIIINKLKQTQKENIKTLWKEYREQVAPDEKVYLADIITMVEYNEWQYIKEKHINIITKYNMLDKIS
jgi:hypothetical protein